MIEIKDLLSNIKSVFLKEEIKKETVREIISRVVGVNLVLDNVEIKNDTVFLNIKPIYKNEVFLKKEILIKELEKSLGKKSPKDIK